MKKIEHTEVEGKRVLVRCDFNVSLNGKGEVSDSTRIKMNAPTINYLTQKGAKVILVSHLGDPQEKRKIGEDYSFFSKLFKKRPEKSLHLIKEELSRVLEKPVDFIDDCTGERVKKRISKMNNGEVLLLENLRYYKEEKENSMDFARRLASLADLYVNDAFSVSHRSHASVNGITRFLPSFAGMLLCKEIDVLNQVRERAKRPVVVIIGGAKIKSKMSAINYFLRHADHVLLGGKIANTVLVVRNISVGIPWPEEDVVRAIEESDFTSPKMHIPVDVIASPSISSRIIRETAPGKVRNDEDIFDIGSETVRMYGDIIKEAGTIIWAGPLGLFEEKNFEMGTREIADRIARNHHALKIVGGGDTITALSYFDLLDRMDHFSCGGGAMLAYLSGSPMPGLQGL